MKDFVKSITPPILFSFVRKLCIKTPVFKPAWVTLSYDPMKGVKMFFDPTGPWQKRLLNDSYDDFFFKRLKEMDLSGKTIFDIGAHVGFHSLYFGRLVGQRGHVYSFEPNPKNIERFSLILKENADLSTHISIFGVALSDKRGVEEFNLNEDVESGRSSGGFIESSDTLWDKSAYKHRGFIKTKVNTLPLDLAFKELSINRNPDILKIDVEGAEYLVLKGAQETLQKYKPLILLEIHSMGNMFNVVSFLSQMSYEMKILKEEADGRCFIEAKPKNK